MSRPMMLDTKLLQRQVKKCRREIGRKLRKEPFSVLSSDSEDDESVSSDGSELLRYIGDQSPEYIEKMQENISEWLRRKKKKIFRITVTRALAEASPDDMRPSILSEMERLIRRMTTSELVGCVRKISNYINEYGLAETSIMIYRLLLKTGIESEPRYRVDEPKIRVLIAFLIGSLHKSIGPELPVYILVQVLDDIEKTLTEIEKKADEEKALRVEKLASFSVYCFLSKSCSHEFLKKLVELISSRPEPRIVKIFKKVIRATKSMTEEPDKAKIRTVMASYWDKFDLGHEEEATDNQLIR